MSMAYRVMRQATRNGKKYNVNSVIGNDPSKTIRANKVKNPVTNGMNEPNVRVSPRMQDGKRRVVQRNMNPLKSRVIPGPNGARMGERLEGNLYGKKGYDNSLLPAVAENNPNVINQGRRRLNRGSLEGGSMKGRKLEIQATASQTGNEYGPGLAPKNYGPEQKVSTSRWRGVEDIKNTATGQAPMSTFFRTREARDAMMASGQGKDYQWAKGTTSWGRVAGTIGAGYAGIDTIDRMGSGGSITRNETGRFDMMGIPIL